VIRPRSDIPRGSYGEKDLNNEHSAGSISPSSKSRSKRRLAARARRDPSPLNDAVTRVPKRKRPNAQKHGVFAFVDFPTMPGEDVREYAELCTALVDEWEPSGPTEIDAVFSLADLMWRKLRAQRFLRTKLIERTFDPRSPTFDERRGFGLFILCLRSEPETAFERIASRLLTAATIRHLKQKFPRCNYQSTSEWAEAVITEIKSILLPAAPPSLEATVPGEGDLPEPLRQIPIRWKVNASIQNAKEDLEADLNLRQRLDAMIHRQLKHLIQLKAWKEMLHQTSAAQDDEQPKRITARNGLQ
jgi:hypothetical protein